MKKNISQFLFRMTIRTPLMAFSLFILMVIGVVTIAYNSKIDVYVSQTGVIKEDINLKPIIHVEMSQKDYMKIDTTHMVKWYIDRNNRIYSSAIRDIQQLPDNSMIVTLSAADLSNFKTNQAVQVEFYSEKERVIHSLVSR